MTRSLNAHTKKRRQKNAPTRTQQVQLAVLQRQVVDALAFLGGAEGERNQRGADTIGRHCTRRVKYRWTSIKALFRNCVGSVLSRNETQITRADTGAGDFDDRAVLVTYRSGSMGLVHLLDVQRSVGEFRDEVADLALGTDARAFDPDGPLPADIPETDASKSGRERVIALAKRENLTVRQIAGRLGVPLGTVKARSSRGLRHLASVLVPEEDQ